MEDNETITEEIVQENNNKIREDVVRILAVENKI